jgi:hypothetical protein
VQPHTSGSFAVDQFVKIMKDDKIRIVEKWPIGPPYPDRELIQLTIEDI